MATTQDTDAPGQHPGALPQTRWSLILEAKDHSPEALSDLCHQYWQPLFVFARRNAKSVEDAQDLTQGFMMHIVSKDFFQTADPDKGRLRALLLKSFKNFMANEHKRQSRHKRGGGTQPVAMDGLSTVARLAIEPSDDVTPELEFDRQWAREILQRAKEDLKKNYAEAGQSEHFDAFADQLDDGMAERPYLEVAEELGVPESRARYIGFKLRQRYRTRLEEIVAETVQRHEDAADELEHLLRVFEAPGAG